MSAGARARGVSTVGRGARARRGALRRRPPAPCSSAAPGVAGSGRAAGARLPRPRRAQRGSRLRRRDRRARRRAGRRPACRAPPSPTPTAHGCLEGPPFHRRRGGRAGRRAPASCPAERCRPHLLERRQPRPTACGCPTDAVRGRLRDGWARGRRGAGGGLRPGARRSLHRRVEPRPPSRGAPRRRCAATDDLVARAPRRGRPGARLRPGRGAVPPARRRSTSPWPGCAPRTSSPGLLRSGTHPPHRHRHARRHRPHDPRPGGRRPPELDGGPPVRAGRRRARPPARPGPSDLAELDAAARYRDRMVAPVALAFVVLQAVLWVGAALALRRRDPRAARVVAFAALADARLPPRHLPGAADRLPHARPSGRTGCSSLAVAVGDRARSPAPSGAARHLDPLLVCLGVVFGLLVDRHAHRRAAPAERRVRLLADGRRALRRDGQPRLRPVRRRRLPALRARCSQRLAGRRVATAVALSRAGAWRSSSTACRCGAPTSVGCWRSCPRSGSPRRCCSDRRHQRGGPSSSGDRSAVVAVGAFALVDLSRPADRRTHLGRLVESIGDQGCGRASSR